MLSHKFKEYRNRVSEMSSTRSDEIREEVGNTRQPPPSRHWAFTLNNYSERDLEDICSKCSTFGWRYTIGREVGESGTPHLQGHIYIPKKARFAQVLAVTGERAHIEKARNPKASVEYCKKGGDFVTNDLSKKGRILENEYRGVEWRPWQRRILDILEGPEDKRTIHWIWEPTGNVGKSFLARYIGCKYKTILGGGKIADVLNQVRNFMEANNDNDPDVMILDVPRSALEFFQYRVLEMMKDGAMYSGKYEGGEIYFERRPHVIVFANQEPNYAELSIDRWNVYEIKSERDAGAVTRLELGPAGPP